MLVGRPGRRDLPPDGQGFQLLKWAAQAVQGAHLGDTVQGAIGGRIAAQQGFPGLHPAQEFAGIGRAGEQDRSASARLPRRQSERRRDRTAPARYLV